MLSHVNILVSMSLAKRRSQQRVWEGEASEVGVKESLKLRE